MHSINGIGASKGIAVGRLYHLPNVSACVSDDRTLNPSRELARFEAARMQADKVLGGLYRRAVERLGEKDSFIFEIHRMILEDLEFVQSIRMLIYDKHYTAELAVKSVGEGLVHTFELIDDAYLRERSADIKDVSNHILRVLCSSAEQTPLAHPDGVVVAAQELLPSQLIQLDPTVVRAFAAGGGSEVSHAAILARALGIPAVVGLGKGLDELTQGTPVMVDGCSGILTADPDLIETEEGISSVPIFCGGLQNMINMV